MWRCMFRLVFFHSSIHPGDLYPLHGDSVTKSSSYPPHLWAECKKLKGSWEIMVKPSTVIIRKHWWKRSIDSTGTSNSSTDQNTQPYSGIVFNNSCNFPWTHWLHQHAFKRVHRCHNYSSNFTLSDTLVMLWWCQPLSVSVYFCQSILILSVDYVFVYKAKCTWD